MKNLCLSFLFLFFGFLINAQTSSTGSSTEVGITEGQLSVSLSGAANYVIPITVPPGINGVVPQISLSYNSQSGNGLAGYGWGIAGASTISRIPATKYHDNIIDPVDFNSVDRFALDGQRLIVKNGTDGVYGGDGTVYETESFSNIKITSHGTNVNGAKYGPAYFVVEYPDGSIAYYGLYTNSRSLNEWAIEYWENPQRIRISYNYTLANNILFLTSIKYGSRASIEAINEIQFVYNNRQRSEQNYIGGQSFINNSILKQIKVIGNGIGFRNYILEHDLTSLGYERLVSITEKSGDNSKNYNPTVFNYETSDNIDLFKIQPSANIDLKDVSSQNTGSISGDFDGDGKTDIILYPTNGIDEKKKFWLYTDIIGGNLNKCNEYNIGNFDEIFPTTFLSADNKILPEGWTVVKSTPTSYVFTIYSKGSTAPVIGQYERVVNFPLDISKDVCNSSCQTTSTKEMFPKKIIYGDFNGDGLTDVIAIDLGVSRTRSYCDNNGAKGCTTSSFEMTSKSAYFVDLKRDKTTSFMTALGDLSMVLTSKSKIEVIDFNGDGKSDFIIFDSGFVSVYTLNDINRLNLIYQNVIADTSINLDKQILIGDFNGDGKTDFVIPQTENLDSWNFYFSTGVAFNKLNTAIGLAYYTSKVSYYGVIGFPSNTYSLNEGTFIASDFNGDGKTDILYQQNLTIEYIMATSGDIYARKGESQITKLILLENKSCIGSAISFNLVNKQSQFAGVKRFPIPIFTNQNRVNLNLEYSLISDNAIRSFNSSVDNKKDILLKKITTGNGVTESITYQPLKNDSKEGFNFIYVNTNNVENYPNVDIRLAPVLQVVTKLEKQNKDSYKKQLFGYYGGVSNLTGLGFLGFRAVTKTNWYQNDSQIISSISRNDISLRGANIENYSVVGYASPNYIPNSFITKSTIGYRSIDPLERNKVYRLQVEKNIQYNSLDGTSSETSTYYDGTDSLPLSITTVLKEGTNTIQTTVSSFANYTASTSPYIVGKLYHKTQSVEVSGDSFTTDEFYTYSNNLLIQVKKKGTGTNFIIEDNVHDVFGNITKKSISVTGLDTRVTSYEYDMSGRFLNKITDIEGLSTNFIYNLNNGLLISETNPYGLMTSYTYDSWFKKIKTTDYLGKSNSYAYVRNAEKTIITSNGDDGSASEETFDDLGRKIKSGVKDINGSFSFISYLYDIYDRNFKVSEPYFGSYPTQWNETQFDNYGRIVQNTACTGKTTNITYAGLTTTVNDGTKTKTSTKNAIGNIVTINDSPGGTINYTYFANGNLKSSNYDGIITSIVQDGWGRKIKLTDVSAGTYLYEYNGFGEVISETTPNGKTIYTLNSVGKLIKKTIEGNPSSLTNSNTVYSYDNATKLLISSTFTNTLESNTVTTNNYLYDSFNRLTKKTETTPYAIFTKQFSFDAFGRVDKEASTAVLLANAKTSAKTIKYNYKNGISWQILDDSNQQILWQTNNVNAKGQLTEAILGNDIKISNSYDEYGYVSQYKHDRNGANPINIMTLNTVFDAKKGNLISRTNSLFNMSESFTYDSLDRLNTFVNAKGVQETQNYDDRGRIIQNNLGTYDYTNASAPYQQNALIASPAGLDYYKTRKIIGSATSIGGVPPEPGSPINIGLDITYNAFKSPVTIEEIGGDLAYIERISLTYNDDNTRSSMFYGGTQRDKKLRALQKFYSADGTMEIKYNTVLRTVEFISYIGGDGYSAPIVLKSDGNTQNFLYLHRDYQGSILAITNPAGTVLEKRLFDAWGSVVKVQDGNGKELNALTILDRGYTGHEHLQNFGLINMNARLYDPKLHRFLQPDNFVQEPFNTQNYNRYGYVLNNPLKYTDYSGESWWSDNWRQVATVGVVIVVAVVVTYATAGMASPLAASMITGATAGFAGGVTGSALSGNSFGQVMLDGAYGGLKGGVFGAAGGYAASFAPAGIFNGAAYSIGTNVTLNGIGNVIDGKDPFENVGFTIAISGVTGGYTGYKAAQAQGLNVLTGGAKPSVIAKDVTSFEKSAQVAYDKASRTQQEPVNMGNTATNDLPLFRGGNNTELSAVDLRSGIDKTTGLMKPGKGLSLNTDKFNKYIDQYGGAFEVDLKSIPKELNLINTPAGGTHFVISPVQPMTPSVFQNYLNQVKLKSFNVITK